MEHKTRIKDSLLLSDFCQKVQYLSGSFSSSRYSFQRRSLRVFCVAVCLICGAMCRQQTTASEISDAIVKVADRIESGQKHFGTLKGSWPKEADLTGFIVAGLSGAHEVTCDPQYSYASQLGGAFIYGIAGGTYLAPEVYAFTRLSDTSLNPEDNVWKSEIISFFAYAKNQPDGTIGYLNTFFEAPGGTDYFDAGDVANLMSYYVVASHYVDADDTDTIREYLVRLLIEVSDETARSPVGTLGIATWALASTGELDGTLLDPYGLGTEYWAGISLTDLPDMLLSHQVPPGQTYEGSFYTRFDHGGSSDVLPSGYTTVAVHCTLGLFACREQRPDVEPSVIAGREALLGGIDSRGWVGEHLVESSDQLYGLGGKMLHALSDMVTAADLNVDGQVDVIDYSLFLENWQSTDCVGCSWCGGADLDRDGDVDFADLEIFAGSYWLYGAS